MKSLVTVATVLAISACSGIQFGREFDEEGNERVTTDRQEGAEAPKPVTSKPDWGGEDDYYGEEKRTLKSFSGILGDVTVNVSPIGIVPTADTREQRWSKRSSKLAFWNTASEHKPSDEAVAAELAVKTLFDEQVADAIVQALSDQIKKELPPKTPPLEQQHLLLEITDWGASDDFGLYASNLRIALAVKAELKNVSGETLWEEELVLDIDDPDRPSASIDELAEKALLLSHSEIAAQFMAHEIAALLQSKRSEIPLGYNKSRWIDEE